MIGLTCSPGPGYVQPPISRHRLSAALIKGSLNATKLGWPSVLSARGIWNRNALRLHTLCSLVLPIYMCVNVWLYALQRVAWTIDACIFNCQASVRVGGKGPLDRRWTKLSHAGLSLNLFPLRLPSSLTLSPSLCFSPSLLVWVVLADLHWDTAMTLIALICQWAPVVAGEHSNTTPKHRGNSMWILLSFRWREKEEGSQCLLTHFRIYSHHDAKALPNFVTMCVRH